MFFAYIHISCVKRGQEVFVGLNKSLQRQSECLKRTFQSFNEQNLHEFRKILLGCNLSVPALTFVVGERAIPSICKIPCKTLNRAVEDSVLIYVELIEQRFWHSEFWKVKILLLQVGTVVS